MQTFVFIHMRVRLELVYELPLNNEDNKNNKTDKYLLVNGIVPRNSERAARLSLSSNHTAIEAEAMRMLISDLIKFVEDYEFKELPPLIETGDSLEKHWSL